MPYTTEEIHALGYAYGLLVKALEPDHMYKLTDPAAFEQAALRPATGFAMAHNLAMTYRVITHSLSKQLASVLDRVNYFPDDPDERLTLLEQGVWQLAYYRALSGCPPYWDDPRSTTDAPRSTTDAPQGIKECRKIKGMTQQEVAKKMYCTQTDVSRWETGSVKPSRATLEKLAEVLECPIEWMAEAPGR